MLLTSMILVPLAGALIIAGIDSSKSDNLFWIYYVALFASITSFMFSITTWLNFDGSVIGYQLVDSFGSVSFCQLQLGVDGISIYYVLLTTILMPICLIAGLETIQYRPKAYLISLLVIEAITLAIFLVTDLLLFYISFEAVLIPMFLLIGIWGAGETRVRAAYLLFLYTLAGSLFMLLAILNIYAHLGSTDMLYVTLNFIDPQAQRWLWLGFGIAFAVKTPLVPFHIWLPRAHSEAPLAGSMILAGLVLKLATYGIIRVMLTMLPEATSYFAPLAQLIAVITIIYSSLATLRQSDTKCLIAYSSVAHMGAITLGVFSNTLEGIEGAILMSLAHGFVSPAMFVLVGGVLYNRYHTRIIRYYRGLALTMPLFALFMFMFTLFNMGTPLSLNWLGEIMSLAGAFERSPIMASLGALSIVLSAGYSIWLYARVTTGAFSMYLFKTSDINLNEFVVLMPLLLLTLFFGIYPEAITNDIHCSVSSVLYTV